MNPITRHSATALRDSAGTRIAVSQAFQPDSSKMSGWKANYGDVGLEGVSVGKDVRLESLTYLTTPLSRDVPGQ
jgi:hypothetical protein